MGPEMHCAIKHAKYYSTCIVPRFVAMTGMKEGVGMQLESWFAGLGPCFLMAWIFDPI